MLYWIRGHWLTPVAVHRHSAQLVLLQNQCFMLAERHELSSQMVCVPRLLTLSMGLPYSHNPTASMWVYSSNNCTNTGYVCRTWTVIFSLRITCVRLMAVPWRLTECPACIWWQCPGGWLSVLCTFDGSALAVDWVSCVHLMAVPWRLTECPVYIWWQCPGGWLSVLPAFDGSALAVDWVSCLHLMAVPWRLTECPVYIWWQCPGGWLSVLRAFNGSALAVDWVAGTYMCWHTALPWQPGGTWSMMNVLCQSWSGLGICIVYTYVWRIDLDEHIRSRISQ